MQEYTDSQIYDFVKHSNYIEHILDYKEHERYFQAWDYLKTKGFLNLERILTLHEKIICKQNPEIAGKLRNMDVNIVNGCGQIIRECPYYQLVSGLLGEWIELWGNGINAGESLNDDGNISASALAKQAHIEFEHIRPFEDGNGRTGRLIWLWHRYNAGLPFEMIREEDKSEYYKWF